MDKPRLIRADIGVSAKKKLWLPIGAAEGGDIPLTPARVCAVDRAAGKTVLAIDGYRLHPNNQSNRAHRTRGVERDILHLSRAPERDTYFSGRFIDGAAGLFWRAALN